MGTAKSPLTRLGAVVAAARTHDSEFPMQCFAMLLCVAMNEGMDVGQLAEQLGMPISAASRNIQNLEKKGWRKTEMGRLPGLDMVFKDVDPLDARRKIVRLTPKGKQFIKQVEHIMEG